MEFAGQIPSCGKINTKEEAMGLFAKIRVGTQVTDALIDGVTSRSFLLEFLVRLLMAEPKLKMLDAKTAMM